MRYKNFFQTGNQKKRPRLKSSVVEKNPTANKILMALSPSGGHIYPALALIEKLESVLLDKKSSDSLKTSAKFYLIYNETSLSKKILKSCPYPCYSVSLGGLALGQSFFNKIKTLIKLPYVFLKALWIIYKQDVNIVFGTGGSLSAPVLMAGFFMRKKLAIWEANSRLGLANRFLTPFVSVVFTVFPKVRGLNSKKQIVSTYPLRQKILKNFKNPALSFPKDCFKVLVLGGSQGSVFLNQAVSQALREESWRQDIFVYHQTGERSFESIQKKYQSFKKVLAVPFIENIQDYYYNCDLIFSRAGSGSISEIAFFGKALVLIPLTHSAGGHQRDNALNLSAQSCADLIEEKNFNPESFKNKILELKKDLQKRESLGRSLKQNFQSEDQMSGWFLSQTVKKNN